MSISPNLPLSVSQLKTLAINVTNVTPDTGVATALAYLNSVDVPGATADFIDGDIMTVLRKSRGVYVGTAALGILRALLAMPSNQ